MLFHCGVLVLFCFSGASALVYQITWERQLVIVFGNTMLATSTVLAAFMAGLAGGNFVFGKYADKKPDRLLTTFALLEAGIGGFGLLFLLLVGVVTPVYVGLYGLLEGNMPALNAIRFVICFCLISISTFLMGGTLPVLSKLFCRSRWSLGRNVALLYAMNTLGALAGCGICGFVLLQVFGISKTTYIAVAVNLATAGVAWIMGRAGQKDTVSAEAAALEDQPKRLPYSRYSSKTRVLVSIGIFLSGFCALAYEVFWARMLNIVLGSTMYCFTLTLTIFLGGIALGSLIYSVFLARISRQVPIFVAIQAGIALFAYLTPYTLQLPPEGVSLTLSVVLRAAGLMIAPTILMGAALPCAVQICQWGRGREGASVGNVYAINTIGAIFGPLAAGFILIPWMGIQKGLLAVAALNLLAGAIVLFSYRLSRIRQASCAGVYASVVILAFTLAPSNLFRHLFEKGKTGVDIRFYKEGTLANVVVYDFHRAGYRDFFLNASEEASSRLWHVQLFRMLGVLPVVVHEDPEEALMIAFGAGMSAGACAKVVKELDCVELNPDIHEVAKIFRRENLNVLENPRLNVIINDGRNQLLLNPRKYSLIISDATNPTSYDAWTIYTREFYELCRKRLKSGGVFCQWIPLHLPRESTKTILNTFRSVFPHVSLWSIYGSTQALMLATPERLNLDYQKLSRTITPVLRASGLTECGVDTLDKFLSFFLVGEDNINRLLDGYDKINTDDLPHTQFLRDFDEQGAQATIDLLRYQESITSYMTNVAAEGPRLRGVFRTYSSISRLMNLGWFSTNEREFKKARLLASQTGLANDENVKNVLGYDRMRKEYLQEWIAEHPEDIVAHLGLGYIFWREGDYEMARTEANWVIARKSDSASAHLLLAYAYLSAEMPDEAAEKFVELKKLNPTHDMLDMFPIAMRITRLMRQLKHQPKELRLNLRLAKAFMEFGWTQEAFEIIHNVSLHNPRETEPLVFLADSYESMDLAGKSLGIYRRIAEMVPGNRNLADKIDELSAIEGDDEQWRRWTAAKVPTGARRAGKADDGGYGHVISTWNEFDFDGAVSPANLEHAARDIESLLKPGNTDTHKYEEAATLHELLGQYPKALSFWRSGLEIPDVGANVKNNIERLEHLISLEESGLSVTERVAIYLKLATLHWKMENIEAAIQYYKSILDEDENHTIALSNLGMCYVVSGRYDEAIETIEHSLEHEDHQKYVAEKRRRLRWLYQLTGKTPR